MNRRIGLALAGVAVVVAFCLLLARESLVFAQVLRARTSKPCPYLVDLDKGIKVEIKDVMFTTVVEGTENRRMRLKGDSLKKHRLAVVTLKVTKPAGMRLTLAAADLTLHYYHGDDTEVTACEGLSYFSSTNDADRPVKMPSGAGPGFVKHTTGASSTKAAVVYCDAIFGYMEPDTKEMWICVAQPSTIRPFVSKGWKLSP